MMNNSISFTTTDWKCSCGLRHPLRIRRCSNCRNPLPQEVRDSVYQEELSIQKSIRRKFVFDRSTRRMKSLNGLLCGTVTLSKVLAVIVVICLIGGLILNADSLRPLSTESRISTIPERTMEIVSNFSDLASIELDLGSKLVLLPDRFSESIAKAGEEINTCREQIEFLVDRAMERLEQLLGVLFFD